MVGRPSHNWVCRANAIATEQEYKAKALRNRTNLVEAESAVPMAMADAFRKGNLHNSAMDGNGAA